MKKSATQAQPELRIFKDKSLERLFLDSLHIVNLLQHHLLGQQRGH